MTGTILRRLREHYGFTRAEVARAAGLHPSRLAVLENGGKSHSVNVWRSRRRQRTFAACIAALRTLKVRRAKR